MREKRLPTMDDVAARASCARATVSMALRQDPRIAATTRSRIAAIARELGYKPNPLVAALMTTRRMQRVTTQHTVLAYVTTLSESDPLRHYQGYRNFLAGAETRATELGYKLQEFPLRVPGMSPARYLQILHARNIHGLLVAPLPRNEKMIELDFTGVAVVGVGLSIVSPPIERVSNDHFQSAVLAVRQCRALGYRRIGFAVSQETSERLDHRWLSGFLLASRDSPESCRVPPLMPARSEQVESELASWYRRMRPDVVLFGNFTPPCRRILPRGVGAVSLDVERPDGELTGIFQNDWKVGAIATDHLVARMQRGEFGHDDQARLHLLAGQWVPGHTATGPRRISSRSRS